MVIAMGQEKEVIQIGDSSDIVFRQERFVEWTDYYSCYPLILNLILSSEGQQQEYSSLHLLDREGP